MQGILRPGSQYRVVWQISASDDVATVYYPQAVIRASVGNAILATLNLTADGNGRYSALYSVPGDSSGLGFEVDMTINIYTDSGHTLFSPNYSIENRIYRIKEELQNYGGGGGFDWIGLRDLVTKIVTEVIDAKLGNLPPPTPVEQKEIPELPKILVGIDELKSKIPSINGLASSQDIKEIAEEISSQNTEVQSQILETQAGVRGLESKIEDNFQVVSSEIQNVTNEQKRNSSMMAALSEQMLSMQKEYLEKANKVIANELQKVLSEVDSITYSKGVKVPQGPDYLGNAKQLV